MGCEGTLDVGDELGSSGGVRIGWETLDQQVEPVGGRRIACGDPVALGGALVGGEGGTDGGGDADPDGEPFGVQGGGDGAQEGGDRGGGEFGEADGLGRLDVPGDLASVPVGLLSGTLLYI